MREGAYAEATDRYSNFSGAWGCLVSDANLCLGLGWNFTWPAAPKKIE